VVSEELSIKSYDAEEPYLVIPRRGSADWHVDQLEMTPDPLVMLLSYRGDDRYRRSDWVTRADNEQAPSPPLNDATCPVVQTPGLPHTGTTCSVVQAPGPSFNGGTRPVVPSQLRAPTRRPVSLPYLADALEDVRLS